MGGRKVGVIVDDLTICLKRLNIWGFVVRSRALIKCWEVHIKVHS